MLPLGALVLPATAAAATAIPVDAPPPDVEASPRLRSGIAFGLTLGGGVGGASGYPNSASEIGDPAYHSSSGFMTGGGGGLLLMGAIADYLNFGFWLQSTSFSNQDWKSTGTAVGLRVEAFPLVSLVPVLSGLGVFGDFGIGSGKLESKSGSRPEANGTQSFIGTGVFYEWSVAHLLGGHLGLGPSLGYDAMWSRPFERYGLVTNFRIVFYGGP